MARLMNNAALRASQEKDFARQLRGGDAVELMKKGSVFNLYTAGNKTPQEIVLTYLPGESAIMYQNNTVPLSRVSAIFVGKQSNAFPFGVKEENAFSLRLSGSTDSIDLEAVSLLQVMCWLSGFNHLFLEAEARGTKLAAGSQGMAQEYGTPVSAAAKAAIVKTSPAAKSGATTGVKTSPAVNKLGIGIKMPIPMQMPERADSDNTGASGDSAEEVRPKPKKVVTMGMPVPGLGGGGLLTKAAQQKAEREKARKEQLEREQRGEAAGDSEPAAAVVAEQPVHLRIAAPVAVLPEEVAEVSPVAAAPQPAVAPTQPQAYAPVHAAAVAPPQPVGPPQGPPPVMNPSAPPRPTGPAGPRPPGLDIPGAMDQLQGAPQPPRPVVPPGPVGPPGTAPGSPLAGARPPVPGGPYQLAPGGSALPHSQPPSAAGPSAAAPPAGVVCQSYVKKGITSSLCKNCGLKKEAHKP